MTVATITGICVALFITVAVIFYLRGRVAVAALFGRVLRGLALAGTLAITIVVLPDALDESSSPVPYLLIVPVSAALLAVIADVTGRAIGVFTGVAAVVMLAIGLFTAMFLTPFFLLPAVVLGVAAIASIRPRGRHPGEGHGQHAFNP